MSDSGAGRDGQARRRILLALPSCLLCLLCLAALLTEPVPGAARSGPPGAVPFDVQLVPAGTASPRVATAWERDGVLYLSASDLSILLDASKFWRAEFGRLTLKTAGHQIQVLVGSDLARIDDTETHHLPGPVFLWQGGVMIPLDLVVEASGDPRSWIDLPLHYSREERRLEASRRRVSVSAAEIERERTGWHLALEAETPIRYELVSSDRSAFVVRFPGLVHDPLLHPLPGEHPWFQNLLLRNLEGGLELSFTPGPRTVGYRVSHRPETRFEIFLGLDERDLREGKLRRFSSTRLLAPSAIRLVALDPGHGGKDQGARVRGGMESQLAWQLCMEVADRLTGDAKVDVVLTREQDSDPGPFDRAETANRVEADLFISFHFHDRPGGPVVFVSGIQAGDAESGGTTLAGLGFLTFGAGQAAYVATSRSIARDVLDAVSARLRQSGGGVVGERLPQIDAAAMPALLLELGSNPNDKWTREDLERIAVGVVEGLRLHLTGSDRDWR